MCYQFGTKIRSDLLVHIYRDDVHINLFPTFDDSQHHGDVAFDDRGDR